MRGARYPVPAKAWRAELVIERSRFLCTLARAASPDDAQRVIRAVSREFADATHNCWAFVAGPPGSTAYVGCSDDGEPHGTAGRPMLTTLLHSGVGEVTAVVTRYYGGVKLGTGGLVRAYSGAVAQALAELPREEKVDRALLDVTFDYDRITAVQQLLDRHEARVLEQAYEAAVRFRLDVPLDHAPALRRALADATGGRAVILPDV